MATICIAAYNEERNIRNSLRHLERELIRINFDKRTKIIVCLNGCNDKTKKVVEEISSNYSFPFFITHSEKGKIKAHRRMLELVDEEDLVFFMDADILVPGNTILEIQREIKENENLKIVSAYPQIKSKRSLLPYQNLKFNVLNLKRLYPRIEVAKNNVSMYHSEQDNFKRKSRIYFHGRFFAIRNKSVYTFPKKDSKIRGDDTFLSRIILDKYGKGSIKVLFDSKVYCAPLLSFNSYLKSWYRIRKDIDEINKEYPKFKKFDDKVIMTLNWEYVKTLKLKLQLYALCFLLLRRFEAVSYNIIKERVNLDNIWSYDKKEIIGDIQ